MEQRVESIARQVTAALDANASVAAAFHVTFDVVFLSQIAALIAPLATVDVVAAGVLLATTADKLSDIQRATQQEMANAFVPAVEHPKLGPILRGLINERQVMESDTRRACEVLRAMQTLMRTGTQADLQSLPQQLLPRTRMNIADLLTPSIGQATTSTPCGRLYLVAAFRRGQALTCPRISVPADGS